MCSLGKAEVGKEGVVHQQLLFPSAPSFTLTKTHALEFPFHVHAVCQLKGDILVMEQKLVVGCELGFNVQYCTGSTLFIVSSVVVHKAREVMLEKSAPHEYTSSLITEHQK